MTLRLLPWVGLAVLLAVVTAPKSPIALLAHVTALILTFGLFAGLSSSVLLPKIRQLFGTKAVGLKLTILVLLTQGLFFSVFSSVVGDQATMTFHVLRYSVPVPLGIACYAFVLSMIADWRTNVVTSNRILLRDLLLVLFIVRVMATWISSHQFVEIFLAKYPTDSAAWGFFTLVLIDAWLFIIIPLTVILAQRRIEPMQIGYTFTIRRDDLWVLAIATAIALVINFTPALVRLALPLPGEPVLTMQDIVKGRSFLRMTFDFLVMFSLVALPEELIFRGMLLNFLRDRFVWLGNTGAAFLSSCAFAFIHVARGGYAVFFAFWMGIVLAVLFVRTRSLMPSMLLHALLDTI